MILRSSPFKVISNVTDNVYTINEIEVDKNGGIKNYIIDGKAWNPTRFRGEHPNIYAIKILHSPKNQFLLNELNIIKNNLENSLDRVEKIIEEYENEK